MDAPNSIQLHCGLAKTSASSTCLVVVAVLYSLTRFGVFNILVLM